MKKAAGIASKKNGLFAVCKAYDSIPEAIRVGKNDHVKPHNGDGGIVFKSIDE